MAAIITTTDITDSVLLEAAFTSLLTAKITASENELNDLAQRKGVINETLYATPHYKVKKYIVAWVCMELCKDLIGKNKIEVMDTDVYYQKYKLYKADAADLEGEITKEMLIEVVDDVRDRQGSRVGQLFIGG